MHLEILEVLKLPRRRFLFHLLVIRFAQICRVVARDCCIFLVQLNYHGQPLQERSRC